jgi:hypothetical protein
MASPVRRRRRIAGSGCHPVVCAVVHSTNYFDTFITIAPDSDAVSGSVPKETASPTVAARFFRMIHDHPYRYTSDDVIFTVHAERTGIPASQRASARKEFFSKGQPCLRSSDLAKRYGWGFHSDGAGKVAIYAVDSEEYQAFASGKRVGSTGQPITIKPAMRSSRKK